MSRSPLAYPLNRGADADLGGAADLQTDVMRFMAILALCLVAIFALVQSIPMAPAPETPPQIEEIRPEPAPAEALSEALPETAQAAPTMPAKTATEPVADKAPVLTRPKWTPNVTPRETAEIAEIADATPSVTNEMPPAAPLDPEPEGFTLRFASDAALMRAVAAHRVGVYAIELGRATRMTVSDSRISFWDASMPNSFHEMEPSTVPVPVIDALLRAGPEADSVKWGVTLPGRLKSQLDALMEQHGGGALIIGADGEIHWEAQQ